jgi:hypothetical protein
MVAPPEEKITSNGNDVNLDYKIENLNSAFSKAAFLTVSAAADYIKLANLTSNDFNTLQRSTSAVERNLSFHEIGNFIKNTSALTRNATDEDFDIEDELLKIDAKYQSDLNTLIPIPDPAIIGNFLTIEDGMITMIGGMGFPVNSIEGIGTIEVLNRVVNGEDIEDVISDIQSDIEKFLSEHYTEPRGVYISPQNAWAFNQFVTGARWTNGLVRYRFESSFTADEKTTAREAMAEWSTATENKVRFEEISVNLWDQISKGIGQYQYVTLAIKDLPNAAGNSTVGSVAGSRINIDPLAADKRTYLHEIGHTLGLMHEHQRYDRDNYVTIAKEHANDTVNMGIVPKQSMVAGLKPVKVLFVTVYLPWIWYYDYGITVGSFDYNSVMNYFSPYIYKINGATIYRNNTISSTDATTVKSMY